MKYKGTLLTALALTLGLVAQGFAAPAGFTEKKLDGITISVPSTWTLAPKEMLTQIEQKAPGVSVLMAAEGDVNGFPKLTIMRKPQPTLSQEDFAKADESVVQQLCDQFKAQITGQQGATDFICKRFKAEKGSALLTQFSIPKAGVVSISYMFFEGPKSLTLLSGAVMAADADKLLPVVENVAKSIKLGK